MSKNRTRLNSIALLVLDANFAPGGQFSSLTNGKKGYRQPAVHNASERDGRV